MPEPGPRARLHRGRGPLVSRPRPECGAGPGPEDRVERFLESVLEALPEQFSKAQLLERAFQGGAENKLPFAAIRDGVEQLLDDSERVECLGRDKRHLLYRRAEAELVEVSELVDEV